MSEQAVKSAFFSPASLSIGQHYTAYSATKLKDGATRWHKVPNDCWLFPWFEEKVQGHRRSVGSAWAWTSPPAPENRA
ncbi:MAG: hypothetical protein DMG13_30825 [Acidobacteria bacterium]|nr:MAG: hypothetical protein DMG13_30825 [Acidobacteriota bacterium]